MSGMWGNNLKISIFGESHGEAVGITMCGLPAGLAVDYDFIAAELLRRAGGYDALSTTRREPDEFRFISGVFNGKISGSTVCCIIPNTDTRSADYEKMKGKMRPSHADYTAFVKYGGNNDYRGGGHFSGRVTAALVVAGALAKAYLKTKGVEIEGRLVTEGLDEKILAAKAECDSVGGVAEAVARGVPAGVGSPFFDSVESVISHLLFSIPGVKGVEFGAGFALADMRGSEANDQMYAENGRVMTYTNNSGGINGGITNGMPIVVRAAFRPTPSIAKEQKTVEMPSMENVILSVHGRHDPCIARRGAVVVESALAIGIADLMLGA
ncbi:MAG: Chorismate synthase [Firmicutes bacterium ADurb.Bin193]|nr:MAG: Chorismate synthase [Firmicutes bacterium ADurb.Bin193]